MKHPRAVVTLGLVVVGCGSAATIHVTSAKPPPVPAHCVYGPGGTPDEACTPGVRDPRVTQANIHSTVCRRGYSRSVRPPVSYTAPLKRRLMKSYGDADSTRNYELDHRISIGLGGDPRAVANLWVEHGATPNSKDYLEFKLYDELCSDQITLAEAQREVLAWPGDR